VIWWPRDLKPWAVLAAALLVSTFFSWDLGDSLLSIPHSRGLGLIQWGACFLLFLWGCNLAPGAVEKPVLYAGGGLAVVVILQAAVFDVARANIGLWSPIITGGLLVAAFPFARRIHFGLAALFMAAAMAAHCRSAVLAMAAMTLYLYWSDRCD
jgi:hypothetical protein